ncbi:MAG: molybdenum cofactor biosynthesis protein A [Lentisphaerae bacterium ADurb.Bin082]|nr:MAG: molybdenum cofactor biosynthesis protein A [Lentisphaerae bacterium ADurb.Bin082]
MIRYTDLKNTNRHNLMEVLPLAKPFTLLVEPSSLCNFHCIHCFQGLKQDNSFSRNRQNMPLGRFQRIIEQMQAWPGEKLKVLKLSLYGEPLINQDFGEMLRLAKEAAIADRIETTTNASLLTPEVAWSMVDCQLDYLRVSIYATDAERHREITGSGITPKTIHENLRFLQEIKRQQGSERPFVSPKMLDTYDQTQNDAFIAMYQDVADELYLDKPHNWIQTDEQKFTEKIYQANHSKAVADFQAHSTRRIACPMPFTTMAVRCNGDVSPCCVDFIGGTNLGNMEEKSLQDLWASPEWLAFQIMQLENRKTENFSCARCDVYLSDHYTRDNIDGFPVDKLRRQK